MTGSTGARKYQHLSSWDSWDQTSNLSSKDLSEVDLKVSNSEQAFARDEAQTPVISVRLCFPWGKLEQSESHETTQKYSDEGHSKPAAVWKRILRKLRANARRIQIACCEGLCWPREIPDYNSFNYNKNFDDGREYWQQHSTMRLSSTASLPSAVQSQTPWRSSSDVSQFTLQVDPVWQRRKLASPSKLRVKKVTFVDV